MSATNDEVLAEVRNLRAHVDRRFDQLDGRVTALESSFTGLVRLFEAAVDEMADFRRVFNRHRHGPPE